MKTICLTSLFLVALFLHPLNCIGAFMVYPSLINPVQLKSDNAILIQEGGITTEDMIIFGAIIFAPTGSGKMEVEVRQITEPFTGVDDGGILKSDFVPSDTIVSITRHGLINGQYHWRARAVDFDGSVSSWQEFGAEGNIDFEIKLVPLYTQVLSNINPESINWFNKEYANGLGNTGSNPCGPQIKDCGCAITSVVMLLRYYGITSAVDNQDVNPLAFNAWLNNNDGYLASGNLNWPKVAEYSKTSPAGLARIHYDGRKDFPDVATLNFYLASLNPVILYNNTFGHFLVADGELSNTYTVKDPAWYGTKKLDEEGNNSSLRIRDYNNQFAGLRLYSPLVFGGPVDGISLTLASPAELLITDSLGQRLGKDSNGVSDNEISGGSYGEEGIGNAETEIPITTHQIKTIWIPQPTTGQYDIQVIGTDTGSYTLESLVYDSQSQPHSQTLAGATQLNLITNYTLNFTPDNPENIILKPADQTPPDAKIYFDKDNKTLKVEGIDNLSQTSVEQQDNNFIIKDESDNSLTLSFGKIKQKGKEIKTELESLQYNDNPIIKTPKTEVKYEWSIDKKTGQTKELEQKIDAKDIFKIQAKYNFKKNETEIRIKPGDKKPEQEQVLPGFVVIKLTTKSGNLGYEF